MNFFVVFGILTCTSLANCIESSDETATVSDELIDQLFSPLFRPPEYAEAVSLLIQGRMNVNELNDGETVLHVAVAAGDEKYARMLVHNGADLTLKNADGKSANDIATEKSFTKLARVLQESAAQRACRNYSDLRFTLAEHRILGGDTVTSRTEFPWMAALGYIDLFAQYQRIKYSCAGTLISDKFILTAAHCAPAERRPVLVRLGELALNRTEGSSTSAYHQIKEIIRHPDYSNGRKINDIALIELVLPVYFSETIRPACLQTHLRDESANVDLAVAGWGVVSTESRDTSNALLKANINTVPWSECNFTIARHAQNSGAEQPFRSGLDQCHYCAIHPKGLIDTCQGDSGGPLQIINTRKKMATVVGVVSTGYLCGNGVPGIYTRVALFIDWIESCVWPNDLMSPPSINQSPSFSGDTSKMSDNAIWEVDLK